MRFYAAFLVDNPHAYSTSVLKGIAVRDLRDRDNRKLTDANLLHSLSQEYPWVARVYKETSGYIHFSSKHIFNAVSKVDATERMAEIELSDRDIDFPEETYIEAIEAFGQSTKIFMRYLGGWIVSKAHPELLKGARAGAGQTLKGTDKND